MDFSDLPKDLHECPKKPLFDTFHRLPNGDFKTSFYNPFEVKTRRRTSKDQFKLLEKTYLENSKPDVNVRKMLAEKLDMTPRGVQVWFQNRRAKAKSLGIANSKETSSCEENLSMSVQANNTFENLGYATSFAKPGAKGNSILRPRPANLYLTSISNYGQSNMCPVPNFTGNHIQSPHRSKLQSNNYCEKIDPISNGTVPPRTHNGKKTLRRSPQSLQIPTCPDQFRDMAQKQWQRHYNEEMPSTPNLISGPATANPSSTYAMLNDNSNVEFRARALSTPSAQMMGTAVTMGHTLDVTSISEPTTALIPEFCNMTPSYLSSNLATPTSASSFSQSFNSCESPIFMSYPQNTSEMNPANTSPTNSRRNSCPPDLIASFGSMNFVQDEKSNHSLETIAEDGFLEQNCRSLPLSATINLSSPIGIQPTGLETSYYYSNGPYSAGPSNSFTSQAFSPKAELQSGTTVISSHASVANRPPVIARGKSFDSSLANDHSMSNSAALPQGGSISSMKSDSNLFCANVPSSSNGMSLNKPEINFPYNSYPQPNQANLHFNQNNILDYFSYCQPGYNSNQH